MSRFRDGIFATPFYAGNGEAPPADEQAAPPEPGEATGPQANWVGDCFGTAGVAADCNGGDPLNPCGFPWYGRYYAGTYRYYDWMLEHPVIQNARSQIVDAVIGTPWGYVARAGTPKRLLDGARGMMEELRMQLLADAIRAIDYGWAGFEKVWKIRRGWYEYQRLKPLEWEGTRILKDRYGNFAGFVPYGAGGAGPANGGDGTGNADANADWLGVHKAWIYTHDRKGNRHHGRAMLENSRSTAWREWLDAATDMVRLGRKISGIMPVIYTPAGEFKTADGKSLKWSTVALTALQAARNGLGIHLTHLGPATVQAGVQNFEQLVGLIKASAVKLDVVDFGANAPAIAGIVQRQVHAEELLFHAYHRSPRTGMNTQGGTKADSGEHTNTADGSVEKINGQIAAAVNLGLVDDYCVLNAGPNAAGAVRVVPAKRSDENRAIDLKILDAILLDPEMRQQYLEQVDCDAITDRLSIPKLEGVTITLDAVDAADGGGSGGTDGGQGEFDPSQEDPSQNG